MQPNVNPNERIINAIGSVGIIETVTVKASIASDEHVVGTIESVAVQTSAWI